jgi:type I restriction enzyme M protein
MDSSSLQSLLKRLCNVLWAANVTNPITYVTQISYLLFLKMLKEMEAEQDTFGGPLSGGKKSAKAKSINNGKRTPLFAKAKAGDETVDFAKLRWSALTSDPDNDRMLRTLRDLLPKLALHPALSPAARALFEDSAIVIPDGATLRRAVDIISPVHFLSEDADVKGDLFEILVNDLGCQKRAAQFRTPRHLIRVIVEMVDPKIGETMCDSAGGIAGFAIATFEHILLANTSPEFVREVMAPYGQAVKRGIGDRLTPAQREFLQRGTLHIFEADKDIIRMATMNAVLHGFDHPRAAGQSLQRRTLTCHSATNLAPSSKPSPRATPTSRSSCRTSPGPTTTSFKLPPRHLRLTRPVARRQPSPSRKSVRTTSKPTRSGIAPRTRSCANCAGRAKPWRTSPG